MQPLVIHMHIYFRFPQTDLIVPKQRRMLCNHHHWNCQDRLEWYKEQFNVLADLELFVSHLTRLFWAPPATQCRVLMGHFHWCRYLHRRSVRINTSYFSSYTRQPKYWSYLIWQKCNRNQNHQFCVWINWYWSLFRTHFPNTVTLIPAWIIDYMSSKVCDQIIHPFQNFNGCVVEV